MRRVVRAATTAALAVMLAVPEAAPAAGLSLRSSAFDHGDPIPVEHSCEGADTSPPLRWSGVPDGTVGFAIVVSDPDAPGGTFYHWGIWNLKAGRRSLGEDAVPDGARQAETDFGEVGYGGPCPPPGDPHRYRFKIYALEEKLGLADGAPVRRVQRRAKERAIEIDTLLGTFQASG